jgi:hypothetical protein
MKISARAENSEGQYHVTLTTNDNSLPLSSLQNPLDLAPASMVENCSSFIHQEIPQ